MLRVTFYLLLALVGLTLASLGWALPRIGLQDPAQATVHLPEEDPARWGDPNAPVLPPPALPSVQARAPAPAMPGGAP